MLLLLLLIMTCHLIAHSLDSSLASLADRRAFIDLLVRGLHCAKRNGLHLCRQARNLLQLRSREVSRRCERQICHIKLMRTAAMGLLVVGFRRQRLRCISPALARQLRPQNQNSSAFIC